MQVMMSFLQIFFTKKSRDVCKSWWDIFVKKSCKKNLEMPHLRYIRLLHHKIRTGSSTPQPGHINLLSQSVLHWCMCGGIFLQHWAASRSTLICWQWSAKDNHCKVDWSTKDFRLFGSAQLLHYHHTFIWTSQCWCILRFHCQTESIHSIDDTLQEQSIVSWEQKIFTESARTKLPVACAAC